MNKKKLSSNKQVKALDDAADKLATSLTALQKQFDELEKSLPKLDDMTPKQLKASLDVFQKQEIVVDALHKWVTFIDKFHIEWAQIYRSYGAFHSRYIFIKDLYNKSVGYSDGK